MVHTLHTVHYTIILMVFGELDNISYNQISDVITWGGNTHSQI